MSRLKIKQDKLKAVLRNLQLIGSQDVLVGVPSAAGEHKPDPGEKPINNAALAAIHERGSPARNIPARPFLIPGVEAVQDNITTELKDAASKGLTQPDNVSKSLHRAGIVAQNSVKRTLTAGVGYKELAPETIAARQRKGYKGTKPLIRTGQLRNSITYVVRKRA